MVKNFLLINSNYDDTNMYNVNYKVQEKMNIKANKRDITTSILINKFIKNPKMIAKIKPVKGNMTTINNIL
jgi:hypothetical protein